MAEPADVFRARWTVHVFQCCLGGQRQDQRTDCDFSKFPVRSVREDAVPANCAGQPKYRRGNALRETDGWRLEWRSAVRMHQRRRELDFSKPNFSGKTVESTLAFPSSREPNLQKFQTQQSMQSLRVMKGDFQMVFGCGGQYSWFVAFQQSMNFGATPNGGITRITCSGSGTGTWDPMTDRSFDFSFVQQLGIKNGQPQETTFNFTATLDFPDV